MKCSNCDGRGAVQIAPNVKGLKRCPVCGGSGKITEYDGLRKFWCDYKCEMCNGTGDVDVTNEEWLKQANTEQLAEWMALRLNPGILLALRMKYHCTNINAVREWLKEKHD